MNQNLLIVDDELEILMGLEELFRYDFPGELNIYTANSALEALKLLNQTRFDVVLTDIKMPGLDGISLYKRIKENWPRSKTVFLTGFHNFEDMYQVVNDPGVRYILKSEEDEVIIGAVQDALNDLQKELEQEENKIKQKALLEDAQVWMKKAILDQIISGEMDGERAEQLLAELTLPILITQPILIFLIRINENNQIHLDNYYLSERLCQIILENVPQKICVLPHIFNSREIVLFIQASDVTNCEYKELFAIIKGAIEYSQEIFQNVYAGSFSGMLSSQAVEFMNCREHIKTLKQKLLIYQGIEQGVLVCMESEHESERIKECSSFQASKVSVSTKLSTLKLNLEYRKKSNTFRHYRNVSEI